MARTGFEPWRPGRSPALPGVPRVIAHRGASQDAPENTLAAFRLAHGQAAWMVELDARLAADGVLVVIHDSTLERTTDGRGRVIEATSAALGRLDAGSWRDPAHGGEGVPILAQALELLAGLGMGVNVELKADPGLERRTGREAARLLRAAWPSDGPPLLVSSFAEPALEAVREAAPELPRALLREAAGADWRVALERLDCTTLHLGEAGLDGGTLAELVAAGVPVLVYTVNDPARARALLAAGCRAVFSDVPGRMLAALGEAPAAPAR